MNATWRVGIDIGGTFTDVVAVNPPDGTLRPAKVRTVADDPVASADAGLAAVGLSWKAVADLMHGTTLITNAIVEERLAPVALVTTEGFADTLAIGRQNRRELYRLDLMPKLSPLVPDALCLEVRERVDADGQVLVALTDNGADHVAQKVAELDVEAVAVVLLHAYANQGHEERLGALLNRVVSHVALSHRVSPEAREYERTSTTVLNAALMAHTAGYVEQLLKRAKDGTRVHLFHSAGGMASPEAVKDRPLALALSGPAAGVAAAGRVAAELGLDHVISFDMGGTTTDVSLVIDGAAQIMSEGWLAGRPVRQPMVAVQSIGAGGGSIVRVEAGAIRVGPESAGAEPGPACYGLGGTRPTVTDANVLLGYLGTERPLGGSVRLDPGRAHEALAGLAAAFEVEVHAAALGVVRVANANMARALRRVTVERGVDARACTLLAFGGAGPMHAAALAREFGISRVVVPCLSSVFSALGCLTAEFGYAQQQTVRMLSRSWDAERLAALRHELIARLSAPLLAAGYGSEELRADDVAAIRYTGQSYAVEVPYTAPAEAARLDADFKTLHRRLYGFATDEPWELEALRLKVSAPPRHGLDRLPPAPGAKVAAPTATTPCWFGADAPVPTPRLQRDDLGEGQRIAGPAVIEDAWSTTVVSPGTAAWADGHGHLHLDIGEPT
ncbi:MAG: hydantoinase/oxoprolinase family protein [Alphaproteobacteria bacterium]